MLCSGTKKSHHTWRHDGFFYTLIFVVTIPVES